MSDYTERLQKEAIFLHINTAPGSAGIKRVTFETCWANPNWWGHTAVERILNHPDVALVARIFGGQR